MKRSLFKYVVVLGLFVLFSSPLYSYDEQFSFMQEGSFVNANQRTAVRYLKVARQYLMDKNWREADIQAMSGIEYDSSIADLWYIRSVAQYNLGEPKKNILEMIRAAMSINNWVDYNKDSARVFCALILSEIQQYNDAVDLLDADPYVYSADAEYIRIKANYSINTPESVEKARTHINTARKIYPLDTRFPEVFFKYEYKNAEKAGEEVKAVANAFTQKLSSYKGISTDTELYSTYFASDEMKVRMLKSFNARGLRNPLYPVLALKSSLIKQKEALELFYTYASNKIDSDIVWQFIPLITEDSLKEELYTYLNSYEGTLLFDYDGDNVFEVTSVYNRGRPSKVYCDTDGDDLSDWICECDFGVPYSIEVKNSGYDITYDQWPYIKSVGYQYSPDENKIVSFDAVNLSLKWTPFDVVICEDVKKALNLDFYIPELNEDVFPLTTREILNASTGYTIPSSEYDNAVIKVQMLDGTALKTEYFRDDTQYAYTVFENNIPSVRMVDKDLDGVFETRETYDVESSPENNKITKEDEYQMMVNLFGTPTSSYGLYLKSVEIDFNGDTRYEYTEEYDSNGSVTSMWDIDADGQWEIKFVKYAADSNGDVKQESYFYQPVTNIPVVVTTINKEPVSVFADQTEIKLFPVKALGFYSVGEECDVKTAQKIKELYNLSSGNGVCSIVEIENDRYFVFSADNLIFGEKFPETLVPSDENK